MKGDIQFLVFAAMRAEVKRIQARRADTVEVGGAMVFIQERPGGRRFAVCLSGIGKEHAIQVSGAVLEALRPALVLNVGSCGGLDPALCPGTVVIPEEIVSFRDSERIAVSTHHAICSPVRDACAAVGYRTRRTGLFTSEAALVTRQQKQQARDRTGCGVVDMETFWIAEAASQCNIPFAPLRVVLDVADEELPVFSEKKIRGIPLPRLTPRNAVKLPGIAWRARRVSAIIGETAGRIIDTVCLS